MIRNALCSAALFIILASTAGAQGLFETALASSDTAKGHAGWIGGFVRAAAFTGKSDNNTYELQSLYGQFGLIADYRAGASGRAYADLRMRYGHEFNQPAAEADLREAWAGIYAGPFDLTLGKQINTWGKTSFINPSDQHTPMNPLFRSPDPDDLLMGMWTAKAKLSLSAGSAFQLLWLPIHTPSKLLFDLFEYPDYVSFDEPEYPAYDLSEGSFGLKYDLRTGFLDLDLLFYNGYRNTPGIDLLEAAFDTVTFQPMEIKLRERPYRINHAGTNVAVPAGSYIFRVEASWTDPVSARDNIPYIPFAEVNYVAEIEQSGTNTTLIAGYSGKYILDFSEPVVEQTGLTGEFPDLTSLLPPGTIPDASMLQDITSDQVEVFNRLYTYQMEETYHSAYAIVRLDLLNERIGIEIPCMYNITTKETTLRPSVTLDLADGLELTAGAILFRGAENSLYDLIDRTINAGYISLKTSF
jgi:hypothetical protein